MAMIVVGSRCSKKKGTGASPTKEKNDQKKYMDQLLPSRISSVPGIYDASMHTTRAASDGGRFSAPGRIESVSLECAAV